MPAWKMVGAGLLIVSVLSAQQTIEDPVMKVRLQRASVGGEDLPPVTRGVLEPPPLSPPVVHVKDMPGYRSTRKARRAKTKRGKKRVKAKPAAVNVKKKVVRKRP